MYFIGHIIIGIVAGLIADKVKKENSFGFPVNLLVSLIGSTLGGWLFGLLGNNTIVFLSNLFTSAIGAILLLWIASFFHHHKRTVGHFFKLSHFIFPQLIAI